MCLTIPGKVISISDGKYIIDYSGQKREAIQSVVEVKAGDYVVVHNKIIVQMLKNEEVQAFFEMLK